MPKPSAARRTVKKKKAPRRAPPPVRPDPADEEAFVETLIETGQASERPGEPLAPGETHEVVRDEKGRPTAIRRRTSLY